MRISGVKILAPWDKWAQNGSKKLGLGATICKMVRPMLLDHCLGCSVGNDTVLWPNGWMDQDGTEPGTLC